jgi:hypothetical protein
MNKIKLFSALVLSGFLLAVLPGLSETSHGGKIDKNFKRWALQFQVQNGFTLGLFDGYILSLRYRFSPNISTRACVNLNTGDYHRDYGTIIDNSPGYIRTSDTESDPNYKLMGLNVQLIYTLLEERRIKPFIGGGPFIDWMIRDQDSHGTVNMYDLEDDSNTRVRSTVEYDFDRFSIGCMMVFGTEFPISKYFGIFAEYRTSIFYTRSEDETARHEVREYENGFYQDISLDSIQKVKESGFKLENGPVMLGLSVYF